MSTSAFSQENAQPKHDALHEVHKALQHEAPHNRTKPKTKAQQPNTTQPAPLNLADTSRTDTNHAGVSRAQPSKPTIKSTINLKSNRQNGEELTPGEVLAFINKANNLQKVRDVDGFAELISEDAILDSVTNMMGESYSSVLTKPQYIEETKASFETASGDAYRVKVNSIKIFNSKKTVSPHAKDANRKPAKPDASETNLVGAHSGEATKNKQKSAQAPAPNDDFKDVFELKLEDSQGLESSQGIEVFSRRSLDAPFTGKPTEYINNNIKRDGQPRAEVVSTVTEKVTIAGKRFVSVATETAVIKRVGGELKYTQISGEVYLTPLTSL